MTAAIFGLLGVIVGAVINGVVTALLEPDGTLVDWRRREAQRLLGEMVDPVEQGALALGEAAGLRAERLDEAMTTDTTGEPSAERQQPDTPDRDFPEGGPVAA